mmetsp:Transcript_42340/g.76830  ORF Transcript_42340/g.76830 Transcript_42340/m.76830 type:complete len:81 (+) Transcript_42340:137-379(+)
MAWLTEKGHLEPQAQMLGVDDMLGVGGANGIVAVGGRMAVLEGSLEVKSRASALCIVLADGSVVRKAPSAAIAKSRVPTM